MNDTQFERLVEIAERGARYARDGSRVVVDDIKAELTGWFQCATSARDRETARAACRANEWVTCARSYYGGRRHLVDDLTAHLMWGDES
ncbi:MAG: hypothetical protein COA41_12830 [Sphingopyxis sp.]|nr:MAG: hypothetical protein COA41_12830 [Sphingopyxis sp.]